MKTCIIFGAGADALCGLKCGDDFSLFVAGCEDEKYSEKAKEVKEMNAAIKLYFNQELKNLPEEKKKWYPERQFNAKWSTERLEKAFARRQIVEANKEISSDKALKKELDRHINKQVTTSISYMGLLDECFEALIAPRAFGRYRFWHTVNSYTRAYLCIVSEIIQKERFENSENSKEKYTWILNHPEDVICEIDKSSGELVGKKNYYEIVRKVCLGQKNNTFSIITTNYTPYAQKLSGLEDDKVAYVNGKLGWFESPYQMCAYDIRNEKSKQMMEKDIVFPYIFVQSSTKPIVEEIMIKEYYKAAELLSNAERIVIVGYKLNCDDNHMNGLIRKALINRKKVVYLSYNDEYSLNRDDVCDRLHVNGINYIDLEVQPIDDKNALDTFASAIK